MYEPTCLAVNRMFSWKLGRRLRECQNDNGMISV